jgi:hypothetical protein
MSEFRCLSTQDQRCRTPDPEALGSALFHLASKMPELLGFDPVTLNIVEDEQQLRFEKVNPAPVNEAAVTAGRV